MDFVYVWTFYLMCAFVFICLLVCLCIYVCAYTYVNVLRLTWLVHIYILTKITHSFQQVTRTSAAKQKKQGPMQMLQGEQMLQRKQMLQALPELHFLHNRLHCLQTSHKGAWDEESAWNGHRDPEREKKGKKIPFFFNYWRSKLRRKWEEKEWF